MTSQSPLTLVADIGGTNTRVALAEAGVLRQGSIRRYANARFPALEAVLRAYLADFGGPDCAGACVAAAGPVHDDVATMTNLNWTMTAASIAEATGARTVALLNDLQAQGHAIGHIDPGSLRTVVAGPAGTARSSKLVIGVGTGFNAAPVHETAAGRLVAPSECGHVGLPVRSDDDIALSRHIDAEHGFASVEHVLSGSGLVRLDAWVAQTAATTPGASGSRTAQQIVAALAEGEPRARRAAQVFVQMLGSVAGNLALIHLPYGGVFLIGGVARAMTAHLDEFAFAHSFRDKGRFAEFMHSFAVHVVEDDYAALKGCAVHVAGMMVAA